MDLVPSWVEGDWQLSVELLDWVGKKMVKGQADK